RVSLGGETSRPTSRPGASVTEAPSTSAPAFVGVVGRLVAGAPRGLVLGRRRTKRVCSPRAGDLPRRDPPPRRRAEPPRGGVARRSTHDRDAPDGARLDDPQRAFPEGDRLREP